MCNSSKMIAASRKATRIGTSLFALVVLTGATEGDWGNRAARFVDTEVHGLSTKLAAAELENRWQTDILLFHVGVLAQVSVFDAALAKIELPPMPPADAQIEQLQTFILDLHDRLRMLIELESQVANTSRLLVQSAKSCDSQKVFDGLNLESTLKTGMFAISLPDPDFAFGVSTDPRAYFKTLVTDIVGFGVQSQNDVYNEALERLPSRVVTGDELFQLSKRLCNERRAPFADYISALSTAIAKQQSYLDSVRRVLNTRRVEPEQRFMKEITARILSKGDLSGLLSRLNSQASDAELLLQMLTIRASVEARLQAPAAANCVQKLADVEDLSDYIAEGQIQADAIVKAPSSDVAQSAQSLSSYLKDKLRAVATTRKATAEGCL